MNKPIHSSPESVPGTPALLLLWCQIGTNNNLGFNLFFIHDQGLDNFLCIRKGAANQIVEMQLIEQSGRMTARAPIEPVVNSNRSGPNSRSIQAEPRKEFIELNAHMVRNLDI